MPRFNYKVYVIELHKRVYSEKYGSYLRPSLYNHINQNPMPRAQALIMEKKLALDLRKQGYAVWFN